MTSGMLSICATSAPCNGPAPPNATSANSRGSTPFCTVRERMALAMLLLMTVSTPSAASSLPRPRSLASSSITRCAAASSSFIAPPRKSSLSSRPSTTLASVTVGWRPAAPVGRGSRHGAGAARPDAEGAALVDIGDRSAARADGVDVDHRHEQRKTGDRRAARVGLGVTPVDDECRYRRSCRRYRR